MITVILLSGSVLALLGRGQKRPLLAQFFVLATVLLIALSVAFDPSDVTTYLPGGIILALFVLTYPAPRTLMSIARERTWSLPLLVLSTLLLVALVPDFWHNLRLQLTDKTSEYAVHQDWVIAMLADLLLVVAGFLVSTRRPGWKALSIITIIALLYLGAAALTVPTSVGSWGIIGGILSILGGLGYIGAVVFEARKTGKGPQATGAEVSNTVGTRA